MPSLRSRRDVGRWILAILFVAAGVNHFANADVYLPMMPAYLPAHRLLIALSGFFEIVGGLGLVWSRTRVMARWGLIALLVAVFPANLHMALNPGAFPSLPVAALWARLPLQAVLIGWVYASSGSSARKRAS